MQKETNYVVIPLHIEYLISDLCGGAYRHGMDSHEGQAKQWRSL